MHDNHVYNLLQQLVEEHQSLWRIKKDYPDDANDCSDCINFWNKLAEQKEKNIEELTELVKSHL